MNCANFDTFVPPARVVFSLTVLLEAQDLRLVHLLQALLLYQADSKGI